MMVREQRNYYYECNDVHVLIGPLTAAIGETPWQNEAVSPLDLRIQPSFFYIATAALLAMYL